MNYTVHGILQARKLECVAVLSSRGPSQPSDRTQISHIAGKFLPTELLGKIQRLNIIYIFHPRNLFFFHKKIV